MDHQFRNAALGGFNKQDVLDYLEQVSKENSQQQQALQQQLDEARERYTQLSDQTDAHLAQIQRLEGENQRLQQENGQLLTQLEDAKSQSNSLCAQISQAQADKRALQEQVDKLQPDAAAYAAVKERSAGVELDAHRRAQNVLDEANEQTRQLHRQTEQWLQNVRQEYESLRAQVESTVSHAAVQLEKAEASLQQVGELMEQQEIALDALGKDYTGAGQPKVAAPMPIPEE
jgi:chromosome segregation ATPase